MAGKLCRRPSTLNYIPCSGSRVGCRLPTLTSDLRLSTSEAQSLRDGALRSRFQRLTMRHHHALEIPFQHRPDRALKRILIIDQYSKETAYAEKAWRQPHDSPREKAP